MKIKLISKIIAIWSRKKIKKLPMLYRGQAKFRLAYPGKYSFGLGSYGLPIVHDWNEGTTLSIGAYCSIAANVQIFLGGNHRSDWVSTYPFPAMVKEAAHVVGYGVSRGDVLIGSDVWLGTSCMILSGVSIGHGAIVAAGAVVSKPVEPYSIVAGNPATHIKWRFDEETRKALLASEWWNWPESEIRKIATILCSAEVHKLLAYAKIRCVPEQD